MPKKLFSMGHACAVLQASPAAIRKALAAAGIEPAVEINGVPYWPEPALDDLMHRFHPAGRLQPAPVHRQK